MTRKYSRRLCRKYSSLASPILPPEVRNENSRAKVAERTTVPPSTSEPSVKTLVFFTRKDSSLNPGSNQPKHRRESHSTSFLSDALDSEIRKLNQLISSSESLPVGGRLSLFWTKWKQMGATKRVTRWLQKGYFLPFHKSRQGVLILPPVTTNPNPDLNTSYGKDSDKEQALNVMIKDLLVKNAIQPISNETKAFFSRVFLVPKRTGGYRLVIDLSVLNQYMYVQPFKMDTTAVIRSSLAPNMWATSIDMSDAYFHVPIHHSQHQFLAFTVGNQRYQFKALPFGLSSAPWVFTTIMMEVKKWARNRGIMLFQYLDDWLIVHPDRATVVRQTFMVVEKCIELGLKVNLAKSEIEPSQLIVFLGEQFDFVQGRVFPTQQRLDRIRTLIKSVLGVSEPPLQTCESLLGLLVATEKTVPRGRLNFRAFQAVVRKEVRKGRGTHRTVSVPDLARRDLHWWLTTPNTSVGVPFQPPEPTCHVQTDASKAGWGVVFKDQSWAGKWTSHQQKRHINYLELWTVAKAVDLLAPRWQNQVVRCWIDNSTAVAYLNKQGGTRSLALTNLTRQIYSRADQFNVTLLPQHLAGDLNVLADLASRKGLVVQTEWMFDHTTFRWICHQSPWGTPEIDLFANKWTTQLEAYMSPCPDSAAVAVNALTSPWPDKILYAFPPQPILDQVLKRILLLKPKRLILIAPKRVEARWYTLLLKTRCLLVKRVRVTPSMLQQPHWSHQHPRPELLDLHMWCLSLQP